MKLLESFVVRDDDSSVICENVTYHDFYAMLSQTKAKLERDPPMNAYTVCFFPGTPIRDVLQVCVGSNSHTVKTNRIPSSLTWKLAELVSTAAFAYFLENGSLIPQQTLPSGVSDEEYLGRVFL